MVKTKDKIDLLKEIEYINYLMQKNGPDPIDYSNIMRWYNKIDTLKKKDRLTIDNIDILRAAFKTAYSSAETMQGFVYTQPHGYRGDFEIIDKIYQRHISSNPKYQKWDIWFQQSAAPQAIRNRKTYFKKLLNEKCKKHQNGLEVLNLASGPCRDILEFFEKSATDKNVQFDCVEIDKKAINYASHFLDKHLTRVHFIAANIFKFFPSRKYPLIWSAGLFDYFDDKTFVRILQRFLPFVSKGGELVIGNFHPRNSTKNYMEFGLWYLHHRTKEQLIALAQAAGIEDLNLITI